MTTASNPLAAAIRSAGRANNDIGRLFARIGTSAHPRGAILAAYRNARRAMPAALRERNPVVAANEVLQGLKAVVMMHTRTVLGMAQELGQAEAARQLGFYGLGVSVIPVGLYSQFDSAIMVIANHMDTQAATIRAIVATGGDPALVIGDDNRIGALRPGDITAAAAFWAASLVWNAFSLTVGAAGEGKFSKQAVAAIDNRTTDCCLRVHAQVVKLPEKFHLTGTPRYADHMDWSPFHGWCRTSIALYLPEYDDGLTEAMRTSAQVVLDERSRGVYNDRHPADAYS